MLGFALALARRAHRCPQRARIVDPTPFSLQTGSFIGATKGGHDGDRGSLWPAGLRSRQPHRDGGRGACPVVAVLLASSKQPDESIPDTKGRESWTPEHFYLQIGSFLGTATVAMMAIADPSSRHPLRRYPRRGGGRWPCPRCGSTSCGCGIWQTSPSRTPKDVNRGPPRAFPCITACSRDRGKGPSSPCRTPGKPMR
jgi:hypothetical protein